MKSNLNAHVRIRALCEGAILIALAQILSFLKVYEFPQGGSVTLEMLPVFFYCLRWGFAPGMIASVAYGILQLIFGFYAWHWQSIFGDYLIAFSLLGLCGLFKNFPGGLYFGPIAGAFARFLSHFITGATVWREYMPDEFFGMTMTNPWFYSLLYNGSYMLLDLILCLIVLFFMDRYAPIRKYLRARDLNNKN